MPHVGAAHHTARIGEFDAVRRPLPHTPRRRVVPERIDNRSTHVSRELVQTDAASGNPLRLRTPLQGAMVLLSLGCLVAPMTQNICSTTAMMGTGWAVAGQPWLGAGLMLSGCLPATHGKRHGPVARHFKALCARLQRSAGAADFSMVQGALLRGVQQLAARVSDPGTRREDLAAVGRCLDSVRQRLAQVHGDPLRAAVAAEEAPAASIDEPLRLVRLGMLRSQLVPVEALERLITDTLIRANAAYMAGVG